MNGPDVPELAIAAFERAHGLAVTVHDLKGTLWPFLEPGRFQHSLPICQAVKLIGRQAACFRWAITVFRREAPQTPAGQIRICHAGFVEWVVPVFGEEELAWVLFAGIRTAAPGLRGNYDEYRSLPEDFWQGGDGFERPLPVDNDQAANLLENLRQLAARLRLWRLDYEAAAQPPRQSLPYREHDQLAERRTLVLRFITERHTGEVRLADLAGHLGLTESRASHAVRESCGKPFQALVNEARLRTAMGLLRHSGLSVAEVSLRSGFEGPRQLHRLFRRETGTTPLQYRKVARA